MKKSSADTPIRSPIPFWRCSNGEFSPEPPTERDRKADERFLNIVEEKHRRAGMSRRGFAESACGWAAALLVINQVYGCSGSGSGSGSGGAGGGSGGLGPGDAGFDVNPDAMEDADLACATVLGDEFIFDVQTHTPDPLMPWSDVPLSMDAETYIKTVLVDSDTTMVVLSGIPGARAGGEQNMVARRQIQQIVDRLAGPRLVAHANIDPIRGSEEFDYMEQIATQFDVSAWKVYPHVGQWRLDDQTRGMPFLERARALDVPIVAAHRGIAADAGGFDDPSSPIDLVNAAAQYPDIKFLTYHSGWQANVDEDHPFDPSDPSPSGVDRLIKGVVDAGLGNDGNVYAELGSTWAFLMTRPMAAAHVLGKLLLYVGEDRVVWGTDSVFTGSPQDQIVAMRTFQIPEALRTAHGYPEITDSIREKIFGLNAAAAYGVDVDATRCAIDDDFVSQIQTAHLHDPEAVPIPKRKFYGPRTRREFLAFQKWEGLLDGNG